MTASPRPSVRHAGPQREAPRVAAAGRRLEKSSTAFRTISEVAQDLDVPQHVLRFWETRFAQVRPLKRGGGRRYYRPEDVALLRLVRGLLYEEGYTIKGVQKLMREGALKQRLAQLEAESAPAPEQVELSLGADASTHDRLRALLGELESLRDRLRKVLA